MCGGSEGTHKMKATLGMARSNDTRYREDLAAREVYMYMYMLIVSIRDGGGVICNLD